MDTKKIALGIMTLSFILLVSGGVSSFVIGLQEDHRETSKRIVEVNNDFEVFSTNTTAFEDTRDELYNVVLSNIYYDTMYQDDKVVKNTLSNYEHLVDELTRNVHKLDSLCKGLYYPDSSVNNKCSNYEEIYEQVINYFVSDIELYNSNVKKYNEYQENLRTLLRIRKYKTTKEFLDYNNDGKFDGREE